MQWSVRSKGCSGFEDGVFLWEQGMLWFVGSRACCGLSAAEIISEPIFVLTVSRSVAIWPFPRC